MKIIMQRSFTARNSKTTGAKTAKKRKEEEIKMLFPNDAYTARFVHRDKLRKNRKNSK